MLRAELTQIFTTFIAVFVIVDPFAVVPVYLSLTQRYSPDALRRTRRRATLVASGILLTFTITGLSIFQMFSITLPAFKIAGGILLLLLGIAQLNNTRMRVRQEEKDESLERDDISVFPLATPLLAGPGAISTVVLYGAQNREPVRLLGLILSVALAMLASYVVLKLAYVLFRVLGQTGLNVLTRIMGMILTAVAVQFILDGVQGALQLMKVLPA